MNRQFAILAILTTFAIACSAQNPWNDAIGDKFQKCCEDKGVTCMEVCKYPPPNFDFWEQLCMMKCGAEFIKCYTGGHNNSKCCAEHGVVGLYGICQDFCDGTADHGWDPRYLVCGPVKAVISKCNYDSQKSSAYFG